MRGGQCIERDDDDLSRVVKDYEGSEGDDCGWVKAVTFTPPALPNPDYLAQALDCGLTFITDGNNGGWSTESGSGCYHDWDQAYGSTCDDGADWMQTTVTGAGTIKFWWMVSSEGMYDCLEFYIDGQRQDYISGDLYNQWAQKSYTVGSGTHTFKWQYTKNGSQSSGYDRGWVDWVQWNGTMTEPATTAWATLNYVYDASGRRIEKLYDGRTVLKYIYDGDHCIAEYGAGNDLHRQYVYGPGVDQPICLLEAAGSYAGTYYYHFDGLGSVVALTNASGNTVQTYDYDVYGRVGALDASHPNRLMFTAREFDKETGLYYYRARYYNPQIGRFLQIDPAGYEAGMNLYRYCSNNPVNLKDPFGLDPTGVNGWYKSSDCAALAANKAIADNPDCKTRECFYMIIWDPNQGYAYTTPVPAGTTGVDSNLIQSEGLKYAKRGVGRHQVRGFGHSHYQTGFPITDSLNEDFSPGPEGDVGSVPGWKQTYPILSYYYLFTPSGKTKWMGVIGITDPPYPGGEVDPNEC